MATKTSDIVQNAIDGTMAAFEKYHPTAFDLLNSAPEEKTKVLEAARAIAEEEVKLAEVFKKPPKENEVRKILAKHLPEHRVALIEQGFSPQTYQIHITKKVDGFFYADFIREGKPIFSQKKLDTQLALTATSLIQIASIIVESVLLVLQAVGVEISVSVSTIIKTAEEIIPVIENSSQLQKAVKALQDAAKSGSNLEIAKAIFILIIDTYSANILWLIIKDLCSNMSWFEWVKTAFIVTTMILAELVTDGAALIAEIILALNSAYEFIKKLNNLDELDKIKQAVK